jgi:2-polyprenyl-6-methoxyphenol hydroxylase-like FAD-dependent oxidoreductase
MVREVAVVLGAGIGGLLAAGVLARYFNRVVVIEKDEVAIVPDRPDEFPRPRKGVPQGPQVHAILKGGENVIAAVFPDFRQRLLAAGGVAVKVGQELQVYEGGGWHPNRDSGVVIHTQSRALLEQVIRDCLLELANVEFFAGCRFTDLLVSKEAGEQSAVRGVRVASDDLSEGEEVPAQLVVDAMGRGSRMPKWLAANGYGTLVRSRAGIDVHYATLLLRQPADYRGKPNGWVIRATAPGTKRGATMMAIEGRRWLLTLVSRFGDLPPLDFPACLEFAKTLEGGVIYDLIRDAEVDTPPRRFMIPEAMLAHFDRMTDLPAGLLPLGDVIANFNPMQAQGMTIAALHAEILDDALSQPAADCGDFSSLSRGYVKAAVQTSTAAWHTAVNMDFSYPETTGDRPPDLRAQQQFRRAVREIIETDPDLHRQAIQVQQMLRPGAVLARADVLARAIFLASTDDAD